MLEFLPLGIELVATVVVAGCEDVGGMSDREIGEQVGKVSNASMRLHVNAS